MGHHLGASVHPSPGALTGRPATAATFITRSAILGTFKKCDVIAVQFLGARDDCSGAAIPSRAIRSLALSYSSAPVAVKFDAEAVVTRQGQPTSFAYQRQRDDGTGFVDIAGATAASYGFFPTVAGDFAAKFWVVASVPGKQAASTAAKVVVPDAAPALSISGDGKKITVT